MGRYFETINDFENSYCTEEVSSESNAIKAISDINAIITFLLSWHLYKLGHEKITLDQTISFAIHT